MGVDLRQQRFGAHLSIAGGLPNALIEARRIGCDCLQVFVKNQRQWSARPLSDEEIDAWQAAQTDRVRPVVAHNTYLVNLASANEETRRKSLEATTDELTRCERLGIPYLVMHPGSHGGKGEAAGLRAIVQGLDEVLRRTEGGSVQALLETTAGQGNALGYRFEHLADILERVREPDRLNVCVDTCHIFAAGYELRCPDGYAETMGRLDETVGIERVRWIHVNDSKGQLGSRLDRHEHIGMGQIGRAGFEHLVNDARLVNVPKILETPKGTDAKGRDLDKVNLQRLRRLIRKRPTG